MKLQWIALAVLVLTLPSPFVPACAAGGQQNAAQLQASGNAGQAHAALLEAAQASPNDASALEAYADFLDRYQDREARAAYRRWLAALPSGSADAKRITRRLVILDLIENDRTGAATDLSAYAAAGGGDLSLTAAAPEPVSQGYIEIPGPLRPFARMAAIAGDSSPDDVLPAVARNVVTNGYQASHNSETLEPTEYMKLLLRYISQAHELQQFAGPDKIIKIETCDSAQTGELLRIIGFRMRGGCGSEVVLETVNAARAFLTSDSGFPTSQLEQALRTNRPFAYDFHPSRIPVLFGPEHWIAAKDKGSADYIDVFLSDPVLCRFYLGMSSLDRGTAEALKGAKLRLYANVLDFFGGSFEIRDHRAVAPGGQRSAAAWSELAGAPIENGPLFFEKMVAKDDGWLASLYDSLARLHGPVQAYLTDPARMKRFYAAVRGDVTSPGPARPVFRANTDMVLLTERLRLDPDGRPHIPGGVQVWKALFVEHPHGKYDPKLSRSAANWSAPDDVIEALFALSHKAVSNQPLKIFMALSDLDRNRAKPLSPATVERLAREWNSYGAQYMIFTDAPAIDDSTILQYLDVAAAVEHLRDSQLRADTAGSLQALIGLWQIFCRHGSLAPDASNQALSGILASFSEIHGERDVFEADRKGVALLLAATRTPPGAGVQERMLNLLAGANEQSDSEARDEVVKAMQRVLDAQQIVSLTSLLDAAHNVESSAAGANADLGLARKVAARIAEIQLPQPPLSAAEKSSIGSGYWTEKHIVTERKSNIRALLDQTNAEQRTREVEAALAPHMRDTLVALNYAHYAPPGAQLIYTNPLFVRAHEFVNQQGASNTWKSTELMGAGWPSSGGGRLTGSLVNLPYALAEAEQNFLVPTKTQALIWGDLVPQMILCSKTPRWWNVTPVQMHWVNLRMRSGETILADAALQPALRADVIGALRLQMSPKRVAAVRHYLEAGEVHLAVETLTPSELYGLAGTLRSSGDSGDPAARELRSLAAQHPAEVSDQAISHAFGTPKPTLANSYQPELLKLQMLPTLMGYSSRIMAESWESNTLYWAALADQTHLAPAQLNVMIPEWTEKVIERIFASHLEDWPALLKSLRNVGEEVRSGSGQKEIAGE